MQFLKSKLLSRKFLIMVGCAVLLATGKLDSTAFAVIVSAYVASQAYVDKSSKPEP